MRTIIHENPPRRFGTSFWRRVIPSVMAIKTPTLEELISVIQNRYTYPAEDESHIRLCLDEALVNAIRHGNGEDPEKTVTIELYGDDRAWAVTVHDQGGGFCPDQAPDPEDRENLYRDGGRGLLLMRELMDEVYYYNGGSALMMKRNAPGDGPPPSPDC